LGFVSAAGIEHGLPYWKMQAYISTFRTVERPKVEQQEDKKDKREHHIEVAPMRC
jgi:hypothetical protein